MASGNVDVKFKIGSPEEKQIDELHNAIRKHRAGKTPREWSKADKQLYAQLPEVANAGEGDRRADRQEGNS